MKIYRIIKNIITAALRNLHRQKGYFLINLLGLAIGLTSFIFIALFIMHEMSYDRFHENNKNIYRVEISGQMAGQKADAPVTSPPMAQALLNDYPEVEHVVRLKKQSSMLVNYEDKNFIEEYFLYADSSFFNVFSFKLLDGDPNQALVQPYSIILSETSAKKYFGNDDPIGKLLKVGRDKNPYKVTGIIKDAPENSHFKYGLIASLTSISASSFQMWTNNIFHTYILLKDGTSAIDFEEKMQAMIKTYLGPEIKKFIGITIEQFFEMGNVFMYKLKPLKDIHLKSNLTDELEPNGSLASVKLFSILALLIIIIAIINFVNLSTAKSTKRAKEVGIRKTLGANKKGLVFQFLNESIFLTFIAMIIAVAIVELLSPNFNQLVGRVLSVGIFTNPFNIVLILVLAVVVGILAGTYPAFVLAAFKPIKVLKGTFSSGAKSGWLRSILVVIQFIISISIIMGAIVVYKQLHFMQNKDLGFDKEQLLIVERPDALKNQLEAFKQDLLKNSYILGVSNSACIPGKTYPNNAKGKDDDPDNNTFLLLQNDVSIEYPEVMGLELLEGRFFSHEYGTDSNAVIVNEATVELLQYKNPLESHIIEFYDDGPHKLPIIGVVKNYNIESLHKEVGPNVLKISASNNSGYMQIRLNTADLKNTIEYIENQWNSYVSDIPFQSYFFEDEYKQVYKAEAKTGQLFSIFAFLAIFIACLGLTGLVTYTSNTRTKEIGIRKVHGAGIIDIVRLFSSEIMKLILISTIVSWTIAYFWMDQWFSNFAYHITVGPMIYIIPCLITIVIAWLAISYQIIRVAKNNPVYALRNE